MECQNCESSKILSISAKCSDRFVMWLDDREYDGYVPDDIGIGSGDYIEFKYCLYCGQIQDDFPMNGEEAAFDEMDDYYDEDYED